MTYDVKNEARDSRPECMKQGGRGHKWSFDEKTGIGSCEYCGNTIDTNERIAKK